MDKEELIGKLQMVYVGDRNALNELIGYYDELKTIIVELQQENKQLREKVNKFNIDKTNNENKSLKGSCKVLGEKNNNQRKELQRLNNKIEKLKVINEEHKKLNGEIREESQKQKEVIDKINNYIDNYDIFKVFSFPLMKRWEEEQVKSSIDYEFKTSLIKDLKDILKEVK